MTRDKEAAKAFWFRFDNELTSRNLQLKDVSKACGLPYSSIVGWRAKHLFPDMEAVAMMVSSIGCSIDRLVGNDSVKDIDPRIDAIIRYLQKDEKKIEAIEVILFGEKAGVSSSHGTDIA